MSATLNPERILELVCSSVIRVVGGQKSAIFLRDPERDELWLLTPAGHALAHIVGAADGATFTGSDRSEYRAGDIGSLLRRALGWEMPVTRLAWWVQGELAPGAVVQAVERDQHGRLTVLAQEGWRIAYVYDPPEERGSPLRRLDLAGGSHEIRLVIDGWR
mgnify:CR=1 FL=1